MAWTEPVNPGEGLGHPEDVIEGDIVAIADGIWVTVVRDSWDDVWTCIAYRDDGNGGIESGQPRYFNGDYSLDPEGEDPLGYAFDDLNFAVQVSDYVIGVSGESSSSYDGQGNPAGTGQFGAIAMFLTVDPTDLSIERTGFCVAPYDLYYSDETTAAAWDGKLVVMAGEGPNYMAVCDPADSSVKIYATPTADNRPGPIAVTGNTALYWNDGNDLIDPIGWYAVPLDGGGWDNDWHTASLYSAQFYTNGPDIQGQYNAGVIRRHPSNSHAARFTIPALNNAVQSGGTYEIEMTIAVPADPPPHLNDYAGSSYMKAIADSTEAAFDSFDWRQLGTFTGGATTGVYTATVGPGVDDWDDAATDGFKELLFYPQYGFGDYNITQIRYRRTDTPPAGTGPSGLIDGTDYGQYYSWAYFTETLADGRIAAIVTDAGSDGTGDPVELIVFDADLGGVSGPYPIAAAARNVGWTGGWYSNVRSISQAADGSLLIAFLANAASPYVPTLLRVDPDDGTILETLEAPSTDGISNPWIYQVTALKDDGDKYVSLVAGYGGWTPDVQGGGDWSVNTDNLVTWGPASYVNFDSPQEVVSGHDVIARFGDGLLAGAVVPVGSKILAAWQDTEAGGGAPDGEDYHVVGRARLATVNPDTLALTYGTAAEIIDYSGWDALSNQYSFINAKTFGSSLVVVEMGATRTNQEVAPEDWTYDDRWDLVLLDCSGPTPVVVDTYTTTGQLATPSAGTDSQQVVHFGKVSSDVLVHASMRYHQGNVELTPIRVTASGFLAGTTNILDLEDDIDPDVGDFSGMGDSDDGSLLVHFNYYGAADSLWLKGTVDTDDLVIVTAGTATLTTDNPGDHILNAPVNWSQVPGVPTGTGMVAVSDYGSIYQVTSAGGTVAEIGNTYWVPGAIDGDADYISPNTCGRATAVAYDGYGTPWAAYLRDATPSTDGSGIKLVVVRDVFGDQDEQRYNASEIPGLEDFLVFNGSTWDGIRLSMAFNAANDAVLLLAAETWGAEADNGYLETSEPYGKWLAVAFTETGSVFTTGTPDECDELVPPDWRNLILDPSGESTVPNLWVSSNGPAEAGSAGVPPLTGSGSLRYVVSQTGASLYGVRPVGPSNECHLGAFRIPRSEQVAASLYVRPAGGNRVVRLTAELLTVNTLAANGKSATWNVVGQVAITPFTTVFAGAWTQVEGSTDLTSILGALGATHWRLAVALYTGTSGAPTTPSIGEAMYIDQAMVPDSGFDLTEYDAPWVEGFQAGCYWEGTPKASTSRTGTAPVPEQPPPDGDNPDLPDPGEDDDDATDEPPPGGDGTTGPGTGYEPPVVETETPDWVLARQGVSRRVVPTNFRMRSDIELPGLLLNQVDDYGTTWVCSGLDGWWTLPDPEVPDMPRAWFDGSFETRGRYAARLFTVTGSFWPRSPEGMAAARDLLFRSIDLCHRGDWFMAHEDYTPARTNTKGAKVWLSGRPEIETVNPTGRTDFSIGLRAPDPIKYGIKGGVPPGWEMVTLLTNGAQLPGRHYNRSYPWQYPGGGVGQIDALVENKGNAIVWPHLTIPGPTNGPMTLFNTDTDQSFRITRALYPDETLQIDCFTKQVTMNGVGNYRFYVDIDADWPMLQPGPNRLHFVDEVTGSVDRVTIEVRWRHGWIG